MALQGHLRSLILAPKENARICDFLLVISSILVPTLSRFRDIAEIAQNGHSRSFNVTCFGVSGTATRD